MAKPPSSPMIAAISTRAVRDLGGCNPWAVTGTGVARSTSSNAGGSRLSRRYC